MVDSGFFTKMETPDEVKALTVIKKSKKKSSAESDGDNLEAEDN
jgi:hypothetical protein